ncbi:MAG: hypothetical protein ABIS20_03295 [Thermoanaerobaculia bacterium]
MSPLAWVGVGCIVLLVLAGIAVGIMGWFAKRAVDKFAENPTLTAAELMVRANPDLELVSSDKKTNTLTVKDKKTGEVTTFSAEQAKNGDFSGFKVKTDKGTATFGASGENGGTLKVTDEKGQVTTFNAGGGSAKQTLPSWLPEYPGGTVQGTFDTTTNETRSAAFSVSTKDDSNKVLDYYEAQLKNNGFKPEKSTFNNNGQTGGTVSGKSEDGKHEVSVIVSTSAEGTQALVSFQDRK